MGGRIAVTPESVREYLGRAMTRDNYHLFYGLHLLSADRYKAVMDALMNGDLQPEELVRLGGLTDAEADALVGQTLSGWTSRAVSAPSTGTGGYAYLTKTLGLSAAAMDRDATDSSSVSPHRFAAARVEVGIGAHSSLAEVEGYFRGRILPACLMGLTVADYVPPSGAACAEIPVPNQDDARTALVYRFASGIYAPLIGPDDATLLRRFVPVGLEPCALRENPALAEWLLRTPRPSPGTKLLLHREAAVRSSKGAYTLDELVSILDLCEATVPGSHATSRVLAALTFQSDLVAAALAYHFPAEAELAGRVAAVRDALTGLLDHRDRLRGFAKRILSGCEKNLIGTYPPA
jgi:hypothetical protein